MINPQEIIAVELKQFESLFKEAVKSNVPLLDRILKYVVKTKGKQLRPMFVLLAARLCGEITPVTYRAASLVELLHTATLVHDDVVDEASERRGFFSVYALWKNKASVLVGDYLLAKGLLLSLENKDFKVLEILSDAVKKMSEGELLQLEKSRLLNITEEDYFSIIKNKTASLLASACAAGAFSASQDDVLTEKLRLFGENTGIAFQIKDDLFDYGAEDVGKPTGNDIREKKLTLPLIYTLKTVSAETRRKLIYIIKNKNKDKSSVQLVINEVKKAGGIQYAEDVMATYKKAALDLLESFPASDAREALSEMVRFTTERKK
ncbi:MAG: polyprenyl synthetase family protein [bacterium]|jgi:octaprenyl-diphosphate synthase|nr:polyprenyl synthetase family protein [Chitinophagaceae bacterium]